MDFKKISLFIIIFGAIICLYGTFQFATNQPEVFEPSKSANPSGKEVVDNINKGMSTYFGNMKRSGKREDAKFIAGVGAVVMIVGGVIRFSIKKT